MKHRPRQHLSSFEPDETRWELLSAYIDGELTAPERQQVEQWLQSDSRYQQDCRNFMRLKHGLSNVSVPPTATTANVSGNEVAERVLQELDRSPLTAFVSPKVARRCAQVAAGLALLIGGGVFWQLNQNQSHQLAVSIDQPLVEIPNDLPSDPSIEAFSSELVSTDEAKLYLLSPSSSDDAYSILLTDG